MPVRVRDRRCAVPISSCQQRIDSCAIAQLNSTAGSSDAALVNVVTVSFETTTWRPKVHGESTRDGWDTTTAQSDSRVRVEPTTIAFDITRPSTTTDSRPKVSSDIIDIGSLIQTLVTTEIAFPIPTIHGENSAPGWDEGTSTVHHEGSAPPWRTSSALAHFESSAPAWDASKPPSSRYVPVEITDDPWTRNVKTPQVTGPGTPVDRQPQVTTVSSRIFTDYPPPAPVTYDGIIIRPTAVTRRPTATAADGSVTTTEKVEFQVAIGSSTLSVGAAITVNDVVISLTTDAAGSTVLYAGDLTTTLPEPTAGEVRTIAAQGQLNIVTSVIGGTTEYILAGQTLAPGHPVTLGDTPISIAVNGDRTVLYVGDKATTLAAVDSDVQTTTDRGSPSIRTQLPGVSTGPSSADPTSTRTGSSQSVSVDAAFACCAVGLAVFMITF